MVIYLHCAHAISLERLRAVMAELFGLSINQGGLCNILPRARAPLESAAGATASRVRTARVVCSDETSALVAGQTWWEWVFATREGVLHLIRPSRGKSVPQEVFGAMRPSIWVSDALASQRGHGTVLAARFRLWLLRALAIGKRCDRLCDGMLALYKADMERRLDRIMAHAVPQGRAGEMLRRRISRCREHLTVFVDEREVPATNNVPERALRPSVIFRKVRDGFHTECGAATYAAFRSVVTPQSSATRALSTPCDRHYAASRRHTRVSNYVPRERGELCSHTAVYRTGLASTWH